MDQIDDAYLKREIKNLCGRLKLADYECFIVMTSITSQRVCKFGSSVGLQFLNGTTHLITAFQQFCNDQYCADVGITSASQLDGQEAMCYDERTPYCNSSGVFSSENEVTGPDEVPTALIQIKQEHEDEEYDDIHSESQQQFKEKVTKSPERVLRNNSSCNDSFAVTEAVTEAVIQASIRQPSALRGTKQSKAIITKKPTGGLDCRCDVCGKQYSSNRALKRHQRIHDGTMFKCSLCDKQFLEKYLCAEHEMSHTDGKPFECPVCYKRFTLKSNMKKHLKHHDGIYEYECNICQKQFCTKGHLEGHTNKLHLKIAPFQCHDCNKSFCYRRSLREHVRIHRTQQP